MAQEKNKKKQLKFKGLGKLILVIFTKIIPTKSKVQKDTMEVLKKKEAVQIEKAVKKENHSQSFFPSGTDKWKGISLFL